MAVLTRRSLLRTSVGLAAAAGLARPFIANAAAKTATAWWTQGFIREEDEAFKAVVADYQKASGNTIDYSIVPFGPLGSKIVAALTSGHVPDVISYDSADATIVPQNAWDDKLVDLSDIVEPQKQLYSNGALLTSHYYNATTKQRGYYLAPYKQACLPFHTWRSLIEEAGYKIEDAPKTWDAFWDFFKPMQAKLRDKGHRGLYALGLQITTNGPADGNNTFYGFVVANGGQNMVTADGKAHFDDPAVKEAVIKSITYTTTAFKDGYVPPGALSWSDADDNNAMHAKEILVDFDGTISTEVALYHDKKAYADATTLALPNGNDGKPMPAQVGAGGCFVPKGAPNLDVAKEFVKYVSQPQVIDKYLKQGLGRWLPAMPSVVQNDKEFWLDKSDPHRYAYVQEGVLGPNIPYYYTYNPGIAVANAQQIWGVAQANVIRNGMTPQAAAEQAFAQIEAILGKYPIVS